MLKYVRRKARRTSIDPAPATTVASETIASDFIQLDPPSDIHYLAARICLSPRASKWTGVGLLGLCYLLVILQGNVAVILMQTMGNTRGLCIDSSDCGRRFFCTDSPHPSRALGSGVGQCLACPLLPLLQDACASDGSIKASVEASGILTCQQSGSDGKCMQEPLVVNGTARHSLLELACARCVHAQRGYLESALRINIRGMDSFEWLVLLMVSLVAASIVAEEYAARSKLLLFYMRHPWDGLQQTILAYGLEHPPSSMVPGTPIDPDAVHVIDTAPTDASPPPSEALAEAREHRMAPPRQESLEGSSGLAGEDMPSPGTLPPAHWRGKRYAIAFLQHIRGVMSLLVVTCVPLFVLRDRADPVSLILNAVAVLFILDADNLVVSMMDASVSAEHLAHPLTVRRADMDTVELQKGIAAVATMVIVLAVPFADVLPNMTILGLPMYLYIVIAGTAWLFHYAEMHLIYRPLGVMQLGWSKQQKKAFDKSAYERDPYLAPYAATGFFQWATYVLLVVVGIPLLNLQRPSVGFMGQDSSSDFLMHLAGISI